MLRLIGSGYSAMMIAQRLSITIRTANTHRQNIVHKLGLKGSALVHQATLLVNDGLLTDMTNERIVVSPSLNPGLAYRS